jgi:Ni/Co efflux regulator RcnB
MNELDLLRKLPLPVQIRLSDMIYHEQKIDAIKLYREETGCDLKTAKDAVEAITKHLRVHQVNSFKESRPEPAIGAIVVIMLLIVILIGLTILKFSLSEQSATQVQEEKRPQQPPKQASTPQPEEVSVVTKPTSAADSEPIPKVEVKAEEAIEEVAYREPPLPENIASMDLALAYQQKLANADYVSWKNQPGLPQGYQDFKEEYYIKHIRSVLAAKPHAPVGVEVISIPALPSNITIDGKIDKVEWANAKRILLKPENTETMLYLQADQDWLYIAAKVPEDQTATGFDQLRFYIHANLDPVLKNERIHVNIHDSTPTSIRETTVLWQGQRSESENERWKNYPISDWGIYKLAKAAAGMNPYRQFEAKLNLAESGLHKNAAFAAFVEIETDPIYENGKFKRRQYLGGLGQQDQPAWMLIQ